MKWFVWVWAVLPGQAAAEVTFDGDVTSVVSIELAHKPIAHDVGLRVILEPSQSDLLQARKEFHSCFVIGHCRNTEIERLEVPGFRLQGTWSLTFEDWV